MSDKFSKYLKTDKFKVVDSITLPHTYCMGNKVLGYISTNFNGKDIRKAVETYEKVFGPSCTEEGCNLTIEEHVLALAIEVDTDDEEIQMTPGLFEYLNSITDMAKKSGVKGFVYVHKAKEVVDGKPSPGDHTEES